MSGLVGPDGVTPASSRDEDAIVEREIGPVSMPIPMPAPGVDPDDQAQAWLDLSKAATARGEEGLVLVATLMALWAASSMALKAAEARISILEKRMDAVESSTGGDRTPRRGAGGAA
jgi:hypothetical protein